MYPTKALVKRLIIFQILMVSIFMDGHAQCSCTFTIPPGTGTYIFNGIQKGVKSGDVICISGGARDRIFFEDVIGAPDNYVIVKNCNGEARIGNLTLSDAIVFSRSQYVKLTGTGDDAFQYGIKVIGNKSGQGVKVSGFSSDFEFDHLDIANVGFAGIMMKQDPSKDCADKDSERPNFTMYNVSIHDCYFHNIGGEGIYLGNSFYDGTSVYCGSTQYPHEVRHVRIFDNLFETTGWESIQVGSSVSDVEIYNNRIYNYGNANVIAQRGGIQMGKGTTGKMYNNFIKGGNGPALVIQGIGENYVFNNIVINPGAEAISVNTRPTPLSTDIVPNGYLGGVYLINNTIVGATSICIAEYINTAPGNVMFNNLIVASVSDWDKTKANYDWTKGNNVVIPLLSDAKFVNPALDDYRLQASSPAINAGRDVSLFGITFDHEKATRPSGAKWDAGAFEVNGNISPTVTVPPNQTISLPLPGFSLTGSAFDPDGSIASYVWTKTSGPPVTLTNETTPILSLADLVTGAYVFRLTATDNGGATEYAETSLTVLDPSVNQAPVALANFDQTITLPTSTTSIAGSGSDVDGKIDSYAWTQISGPAASALVGANSPKVTINNLLTAGEYIFRLTVTDDDGAIGTDEVSVTVKAIGANTPPIANAGPDRILVLPTNSLSLPGTGSDPDGQIATFAWIKQSGPAATLSFSNTTNLHAKNLVLGTYVFRLTVTDNGGLTHFDEVTVNVTNTNQAPVANAGSDKSLILPTNSITLNGTGSDVDGSIVSYGWSKISSLTATMVNANISSLTVNDMAEGTHTFRLMVTDNLGATHSDDVNVSVVQTTGAPTADAGPDKTIVLPVNTTSLIGSGVDIDGSIASYLWEKVSGPSVTLGATNMSTLNLSELVEGVYSFRLTVTDNVGAMATDLASVFVLPATTNQAPTVNAGSDITLTLPANSTSITGTATDSDGSIASFLWTKISGPAATLAGTTTATLSLSNLLEGVYTFRFTATDNQTATSSDDVKVTVTSANQSPVVNGGADQTLILPTNSTTLTATASDPDGTISVYLWTKLDGGAATLSGQNTATLSLSGLVQDSYLFRITVTDNQGSETYDHVKIVVQSATNVSPTVSAGNDVTIFLPTNTLNLTGIGTDADGTIASYFWEKTFGGAATLLNTNNKTVTINDMVAGAYVFRVTVTDDLGATAFDDVIVTVQPQGANELPVADAGPNIALSLPNNSINLIGSASDADGVIVSYSWQKESGPTVTMLNANSAVLSLNDLVEGIYVFRLTVTDNSDASSSATCQVTVLPPSVNQNPIVEAGNNITLVLPTNSVSITAVASDPDGGIASYSWTKMTGPTANSTGDTNATLNLSDLVEGTYLYRITVTDNQGATSFDEVTITILASGSNQPPIINTGADKVLFLPYNSLNITGIASDDDGSIVSYQWVKIQGPGVSISNATLSVVSLTNMEAGQFTFRLTATDNDGASAFDEVVVTVFPGTINQNPVANAGANKTIVLPNSTATVSGSAFDPDGSIVSYSWAQISGASSTLENVNSPTLIINNLDEGIYRYQLTVTDDDGSEGSDIVEITVVPEGTNQPPMADAGFDQVIYLPNSSTELNGAGTDVDGSINSFVWERLSGPAVTLSGETTAKLSMTNLLQGSYKISLTVRDNGGLSNSDDVSVTVFPGSVNSNPTVDAGKDVFIRLPANSSTLEALATDADGTIASYVWTKISGPAVTENGGNTSVLSISNMELGTYIFKIEVTDNSGATGSDEVTVFIAPSGANQPPVVTAGVNQILILPSNSIKLNGSAFDMDGIITYLQWTQVSGPSAATLSNASTTTLNASDLVLGQYVFRLTAEDNENAQVFSDVTIDVNISNQPPVISTLNDTTLYLPANFISFEGSATDPDGFIISYEWTQVGGSPAVINLDNSPAISISDLLKGSYTFTLTVSDNLGATASEEVTVTVLEDQANPIGATKLFSPNNDTQNDVWIVKNISMIESCPIQIFNRLGSKVFEAQSYSNDWNATINGKPLDEGDYYYVIQCSSSKKYSGAIRLIR